MNEPVLFAEGREMGEESAAVAQTAEFAKERQPSEGHRAASLTAPVRDAAAKLLWGFCGRAKLCGLAFGARSIFRGAHRRGAYDPVSRVAYLVNEVSQRFCGSECGYLRKEPENTSVSRPVFGGRPRISNTRLVSLDERGVTFR